MGSINPVVRFFKNYALFLHERALPVLAGILTIISIYFICQIFFEPVIQDELVKKSSAPIQNSKVTLALIDSETLDKLKNRFGRMPWTKETYLEIFQKLNTNDPAVILFDSYFDNLDPTTDTDAIKAMKNIGNLIMGYQSNRETVYQVPEFYHLNLGVVITDHDNDGKFRSLLPIFQELTYGEKTGVQGIFPSMALAASLKMLHFQARSDVDNYFKEWIVNIGKESDPVEQLQGESSYYMTISPNGEVEKGRKVKLDKEGKLRLRWYKPLPVGGKTYVTTHPTIPLHRFLDTETPLTDEEKVLVQDRILIIGSSAASLGLDIHATPISASHLGADIHATAIDNILNEEYMTVLSDWQNFLLIALFTVPTFYLRIKLKHLGPTFLYTIALMGIYLLIVLLELTQGVLMDIATPEIFMIIAFTTGTFFKELDKDKEVQLLEKNISKLVSKEVFLEIQKMGKAFQTSGNRMEITSVFVDLRNFTTLSENLAPTDLKDILNEFYSLTEEVTLRHRGTIDKFLGDGILIMFGIVPTENHASDAVMATRETIQVVQQRIAEWNSEKNILANDGTALDIGVSINSGITFVGFLGTPDRLSFTAVGDAVNTSARLQDMAKKYKTRMVISEHTVALLKDVHRRDLKSLGRVRIRGRETPLEIFTYEEALFDCELSPPIAESSE